MKRLAACLCALGFLVSFVPAISSGSAGGPYDSVTGAGVRGSLAKPTTPFINFDVSAHNGPHGVFGTYNSRSANPLVNFNGDVTCLYVNGDHAMVGGLVRKGGDTGQVGTAFFVGFIDNPSPTPDQVTLTSSFNPPPAPTAADCAGVAAVLFTLPVLPLISGNVEVNDAP